MFVSRACATDCPNAPKAAAPPAPPTGYAHEYEDGSDYGPQFAGKCQYQFFDGSFCNGSPEGHGVHKPAPPAPVSEPSIDWKRVLKFANEYEDDWTPGDLPNASRAILSLIADNTALKAQLDTDREVLKETENNISNLAKFAASPITPNYNLPMSGLAIAIRDSLAAALGREILLTQEWDALLGKAAALELELKASDESRLSSTHNLCVANAELERLRDLILDIADGQEDGIAEASAIRAAREAGKA